MDTGFTDDEVLILLALDAELGPTPPIRWSRLRSAAWWVALALGSVAGMLTLVQFDVPLIPSSFGG